MDNSTEMINELVLELSLASNLPRGPGGRDLTMATAAANSLACRTKDMELKELRTFEWTIPPLLELLIIDIEHPVASKAALILRTLMPSRICISRLIESDGLQFISKVLDILLAKKITEMKTPGTSRSIVENLVVCYREVARYYPWKIVDVGGIRHAVLLLRFGDIILQTIVSTTLASLSADLDICKQMFSYGAIKPLLNVSDGDVTNEACMLAGLGCVVQLCRIPEIGIRMVAQGVIKLLEKGIMRTSGHGNISIREKSLYSLCYLSSYKPVQDKICTDITLQGIYNEYQQGTIPAKESIMKLLMNCVGKYNGEKEFVDKLKDDLIHLLKTAPWNTKNLAIKAITVIYRENEDRMYMVEHGVIDTIFDLMKSKSQDLQEAPIVALLHLCVHPDIPFILLDKGCANIAVSLLNAEDVIIQELAIILLKSLLLYNKEEVERVTPEDKQYVLKRDIYNPQLYGAEYGGLIQDYLQTIVENRRDQNYLIAMFTPEEIKEQNLTQEELESYQLTFMELDADCRGNLDVDELKLLMVLMGEVMDKEEIQELLDEYDTDKSGNLDFKEFVVMMKGWNTRFGTGLTKMYNVATKRGAIGKARRLLKKTLERDRIEAAEVRIAKAKYLQKDAEVEELKLNFLPHEQLQYQRDLEKKLRDRGFIKSPNYGILPPIKNTKN